MANLEKQKVNLVIHSIDVPTQFFKVLADETRLKILSLILDQGELCVCELVTALNTEQPKVSRHLALLRKAEILSDRKNKQWVFYNVNLKLEKWQRGILEQISDNIGESINQERTSLIAMGNRPTRQQTCCD